MNKFKKTTQKFISFQNLEILQVYAVFKIVIMHIVCQLLDKVL